MTVGERHFQLFRELLPRRQLTRRWLQQRANQLDCCFIGVAYTSSSVWVAFAPSPGIDVAMLVRSFCAVHRHFIYLETIDKPLTNPGYGCVIWRDDQLVLAGEYTLTELHTQLIELAAQLADAYWLVSASMGSACWTLPMVPATAERVVGSELDRKALAAARMRPLKFYGQRLRLATAVTGLLVVSGLAWLLLCPEPAIEPSALPIDIDASVSAQFQQSGFSTTYLTELLQVHQQLQERLEKLPGWQLTNVRFPHSAQHNQIIPTAEWQFTPQGGSRRNLTAALEQLELFSSPSLQQTRSEDTVTFTTAVAGAMLRDAGILTLRALPLSQQVNWLLDELPFWFSDMRVQPGEVRRHQHDLLSQVISLDLHKIYPEDLQNLVQLSTFLQVRLLAFEFRYQQPYWRGQLRLELFNAQGAGDD